MSPKTKAQREIAKQRRQSRSNEDIRNELNIRNAARQRASQLSQNRLDAAAPNTPSSSSSSSSSSSAAFRYIYFLVSVRY
jgi:hypothetical protein